MSNLAKKNLKKELLRRQKMKQLRMKLIICLVIYITLFGLLQYILILFFNANVPYEIRSANENNSYEAALRVDDVYIIRKVKGNSMILLSDGKEYSIQLWPRIARTHGMKRKELIARLKAQDIVTAVIQDGRWIVALNDSEMTYLSVQDYNQEQKIQSVVGYGAVVFLELVLLGFAFAYFIIIYADFCELFSLKRLSREWKNEQKQVGKP